MKYVVYGRCVCETRCGSQSWVRLARMQMRLEENTRRSIVYVIKGIVGSCYLVHVLGMVRHDFVCVWSSSSLSPKNKLW